MILKKKYVIKLCGVNNLVCEFDKITLIVSVCRFSQIFFFSFLIELDYVIVYFF